MNKENKEVSSTGWLFSPTSMNKYCIFGYEDKERGLLQLKIDGDSTKDEEWHNNLLKKEKERFKKLIKLKQ